MQASMVISLFTKALMIALRSMEFEGKVKQIGEKKVQVFYLKAHSLLPSALVNLTRVLFSTAH